MRLQRASSSTTLPPPFFVPFASSLPLVLARTATTRALGLPAAFSLTACRFARVSARAALAFAVLLTARLADRFVPVPVAS